MRGSTRPVLSCSASFVARDRHPWSSHHVDLVSGTLSLPATSTPFRTSWVRAPVLPTRLAVVIILYFKYTSDSI